MQKSDFTESGFSYMMSLMRTIVIAPLEAHVNLYKKYRKDNPFCDVKFYTLESFLREANYQFDDSAVIYLIKKYDLDYELSYEYLNFIKRIKVDSSINQKINELIKIKNDLLSQNLLFKNEYFDYEISHAKIEIYFYSEQNKELLDIIRDKNYEFIDTKGKEYPHIYNFANNIDELSFVLNKMAELISKGVSAQDIYLYGLSDADELAYLRLKESYKLQFNNVFRKDYLSKNYVVKFINDVKEVGVESALNNIINKEDETYEEFLYIVNKFNLEIDKVRQSEIYKSIFRRKKLESTKYLEAINVINKPIAKEGGYLFIVNFVQGKYPRIKRDVDYLLDEEKEALGLNTSVQENSINIDEFSKYLQQNANIFVSYSNRNSSEKYYPSPLIKLLGLTVISDHIISEFYSDDEAKLVYANLKDLRRNYLDKNPLLKAFEKSNIPLRYRTYDYRFKKVDHFIPLSTLTLSYSQVKTYCQCKYKYYLDRVLNLDEQETTFNMNVGNLAHKIFERIDEGKSFDELYGEEIKKIDSFSEYDWVYLKRIKEEIKKTYEYILRFEKQISNKNILRETNGSPHSKEIKLDDNTNLVGKIDKLVLFGDNNFAIIDYKLGHEEFSEQLVPYGLSLQLPTYALIAKEGDRFNDKNLAGLFIQRILVNKAISCRVDSDKEEKPLLTGVYLADTNIIKELDSSLSESPSNYLYSCKLKKDGTFATSKRAKDKPYFDELSEIARKYIIESSHSILSNDFKINPKIISGENRSCKYCPYRDICYRDERAYEIISNGTGEEDGTDA